MIRDAKTMQFHAIPALGTMPGPPAALEALRHEILHVWSGKGEVWQHETIFAELFL